MMTDTKTNKYVYNDIKLLYENYYKNGFKYQLDQKFVYNTENKKYNIVIGVKDREKYLYSTVQYLKNSINFTENPNDYNIIICEHNFTPKHKFYCLKNKIDYGFIDLNKSNTGNLYSRSLAFNYAVKCFNSSDWYLLHDCDLLTPNEFFKNLEKMVVNCKTWIQPYSEKMVLNLSANDTNEIQNNLDKIYNLDDEYNFKVTKNTPGAVGGSILVSKELFYEVGGFDNELFYGYAPEDALFWFKLECLFKKIEYHTHWYNHFGSAEYATQNNLYHQWHTNELKFNLNFEKMLNIRNDYVNLSYDEIKNLIKIKKELFANA